MSGTLALVGGAEWTSGCSFDAELLAASGTDRVVIVPTAAAYEQPGDLVHRAEEWFAGLGASVSALEVYRRSDALIDGAADLLRDAKFVYVSGGSPMHLRSVLKDTPVWEAIVNVWRNGGVVAGSGEGATVMCTHMVDSRGGAFTVGLDLLDEMTVIPRYNQWSEDKWHRTVRLAPSGMAIAGIDEATALMWDGVSWRVGGAGSVTVHRNGHRGGLGDLPRLD